MATPAPSPVLYLDLDDTLISWRGGSPHAARGAREFLLWALERYEVRWLTTWCPTGTMRASLIDDLSHMLGVPAETLRGIRGFDWEGRSKLDGIAWVEHVLLGRPFLWIEDDYGFGETEVRFLAEHRMLDRYRWCNVTEQPDSLMQVHEQLMRAA